MLSVFSMTSETGQNFHSGNAVDFVLYKYLMLIVVVKET